MLFPQITRFCVPSVSSQVSPVLSFGPTPVLLDWSRQGQTQLFSKHGCSQFSLFIKIWLSPDKGPVELCWSELSRRAVLLLASVAAAQGLELTELAVH